MFGTYKMFSKIKTNCVHIHWMEMMCVEVAPSARLFLAGWEQRQELKCSRKWENAIKRCRKSCSFKIRFIIYIFTTHSVCFSLSLHPRSLSCVCVRAHSFLIHFSPSFLLTHSACIHVDVSNIQSHANGFNLHTKWKCARSSPRAFSHILVCLFLCFVGLHCCWCCACFFISLSLLFSSVSGVSTREHK